MGGDYAQTKCSETRGLRKVRLGVGMVQRLEWGRELEKCNPGQNTQRPESPGKSDKGDNKRAEPGERAVLA